MDESKIREHLEEANQHVKKGEDLIEQQEERVEEMARDGHQTKIHKQYLEAFERWRKRSRRTGMLSGRNWKKVGKNRDFKVTGLVAAAGVNSDKGLRFRSRPRWLAVIRQSNDPA